MTNIFDPSKPVQTRDGRKARIICIDRVGTGFPIVALVMEGAGEACYSFESSGQYYLESKESGRDLVNVPERTSTWQNVYEDASTSSRHVYYSRERALEVRSVTRDWRDSWLGCLRRDYVNGVFVDAEFEKASIG